VVGESGCGKSITALSVMGLIPSPPGKIAGGAIRLDGEDLTRASPQRLRALRGAEAAMIFQEPMSSLNPVFCVGDQIAEAIMLHQKVSADRAFKDAIALLDRVGIPRPRQARPRLPAPVVGGHAPAGDDRDGGVVPAQGADRGRADDRAGRDRAGPDLRPAQRDPARFRGRHHPDHPRHGRDQRNGRPRGGDVCRARHRGGRRRRRAGPRPASLYPRADLVHPGAGQGRRRAGRDPRHRPAPAPSGTGLRLCRPLRAQVRAVHVEKPVLGPHGHHPVACHGIEEGRF
jgi:hypothetical protein